MKAGLALGAMLVLLGGCGDYPRDVAHTSDRVKASGVIRVGLVAGGDADTARAYIARVERATGARARATTGASEHLLARLEDGQLDLVLGPFAKDSPWADDVATDPDDPRFSLSLGGHPFFVIGLHPLASRIARRFEAPALVFNSHRQFDRLRADGRYAKMQAATRQRDLALQGSLNPNLADFGAAAETRQYSGRAVEADWRWSGDHYRRTAEDWLANYDRNAREIGVVLREVYGDQAVLWRRRWRLFFLATAGLFGHRGGAEWGVSHYRLRPA